MLPQLSTIYIFYKYWRIFTKIHSDLNETEKEQLNGLCGKEKRAISLGHEGQPRFKFRTILEIEIEEIVKKIEIHKSSGTIVLTEGH